MNLRSGLPGAPTSATRNFTMPASAAASACWMTDAWKSGSIRLADVEEDALAAVLARRLASPS